MPETPGGWPRQPDAAWPAECLLEGVGAHPELPWLAAACTNAAEERGAVLVFDARSAAIRSTTGFESYVGWSQDSDLLRWHPDGLRLGTNTGTNGIALLDRARVVGHVFPDETRDTGVRYVWVDDRMFTDTGALFAIQPGDQRFDLARVPGAPPFEEITWNAGIGAVVGGASGPGHALPGGPTAQYPDGVRVITDRPPPVRPGRGSLLGSSRPGPPSADGPARCGVGSVRAREAHSRGGPRARGQESFV